MIGSLNFVTNSTRPEVQFSVGKFERFGANPKLPHYQAVKRVLKYIKGTPEQGLIINPDPDKGI